MDEETHTEEMLRDGKASFAQFADEHLTMVIEHTDLMLRERLRRVCKRRNYILNHVVEVLFVHLKDNHVALATPRSPVKNVTHPPEQRTSRPNWRCPYPRIHTLVVDFAWAMSTFAHCRLAYLCEHLNPTLRTLQIAHMVDSVPCILLNGLTRLIPPSIAITFLRPLIMLTPDPFRYLRTSCVRAKTQIWRIIQTDQKLDPIKDYYVKVLNMTFLGGMAQEHLTAVENFMWPCSDDTGCDEWLARNAPTLNGVLGFLTPMDRLQEQRTLEYKIRQLPPPHGVLCAEHGLFCAHLDALYYRRNINGHLKRFLAVCLMALDHGQDSEGLKQAPHNFYHELYHIGWDDKWNYKDRFPQPPVRRFGERHQS